MKDLERRNEQWEERDLRFVLDLVAPETRDRERLARLMMEEEAFRKAMVGDDRVFARIVGDEAVMLKISPVLYFEVLLRKTHRELQKIPYTLEHARGGTLPVFDARKVVELLEEEAVLQYLAQMLASFVRIESYSVPVRVRRGVWRDVRFNDMDLDSLLVFCERVHEKRRFKFYKRIADVCLFLMGVFPEHASLEAQFLDADDEEVRGGLVPGGRTSEEYEAEGRRYYALASEHQEAKALELSETLWRLHENFALLRKPLGFLRDHYLHQKKQDLFNLGLWARGN